MTRFPVNSRADVWSWAALAFLAGAYLFGCGGEGPSEPPPSITVNVIPSGHTFTALGDTARFDAVLIEAGGDTIGVANFEWSSSDEDVVRVDTAGLVTAVAPGSRAGRRRPRVRYGERRPPSHLRCEK
jgi:hypothetical protein